MIEGFHHIALTARDFAESCKFYTEVLGLTEKMRWETGDGRQAVMIDAGNDNYLEIFSQDSKAEEDTHLLHLALRAKDCDRVLEKVREYGAEITMEVQNLDIPSDPVLPVRIAFFKGPSGEIVELFQER